MWRKVAIGIGIGVAAFVGVGFLLPDTVTVTRHRMIAAPAEAIYPFIATPRQWPTWSPWNARDRRMTITYSGPESGTGAAWAWQSATEGDGAMVMTRATAPSDVAFELTIAGMGPPSRGEFSLRSERAGTLVTWTMTSRMGLGPLGGWFGLAFRPMLERDFDDGLAALGRRAEGARAVSPAR